MTVLNTGSTKKFSAGWEAVFRKGGAKSAAAAKPATKKSAAKKKAGKKK